MQPEQQQPEKQSDTWGSQSVEEIDFQSKFSKEKSSYFPALQRHWEKILKD